MLLAWRVDETIRRGFIVGATNPSLPSYVTAARAAAANVMGVSIGPMSGESKK
jgi:hypothetical protein